jgi:hypothetical protein
LICWKPPPRSCMRRRVEAVLVKSNRSPLYG